jgi:hypothetical protein
VVPGLPGVPSPLRGGPVRDRGCQRHGAVRSQLYVSWLACAGIRPSVFTLPCPTAEPEGDASETVPAAEGEPESAEAPASPPQRRSISGPFAVPSVAASPGSRWASPLASPSRQSSEPTSPAATHEEAAIAAKAIDVAQPRYGGGFAQHYNTVLPPSRDTPPPPHLPAALGRGPPPPPRRSLACRSPTTVRHQQPVGLLGGGQDAWGPVSARIGFFGSRKPNGTRQPKGTLGFGVGGWGLSGVMPTGPAAHRKWARPRPRRPSHRYA